MYVFGLWLMTGSVDDALIYKDNLRHVQTFGAVR